MTRKPRILHCHSTFSAGGKEVRAVKLMNAFGGALEHSIVSGELEEMGARALISNKLKVDFPEHFPALKGFPSPGRLVAIAQAMKPYDLVLTYNWGAMDAVMAHTVFAQSFGLPPLIHHEDGFNEDEVDQLKPRRNWYRRAALSKASGLVVPSKVLERIAVDTWKQPPSKVIRIPNGIDTKAFAGKPKPGSLRVVKREGERWVGSLAGLRPVKRLPMLVEACVDLPENWHLVILGEGPERDAILEAAVDAEISHRVHLPGAVSDPASVIGLFDIFALSSQSEQFPLSVVEAMAAGLPVAAPDIGDIRAMVSEENRAFIATSNNRDALGTMIEDLAESEDLRRSVGLANQARAREQFDEAQMLARYKELYAGALGRDI